MKHELLVSAVAFSLEGTQVVSGNLDGTARVWRAGYVLTGDEVNRMTHGDSVYAVTFSPDWHWIVTGSGMTARVWAWQPQDVIALLCARLPRNFTKGEWQQFFGDLPYRQTCENLPAEK